MLVFHHEVLGADYAALAVDAGGDAVGNHVLHFRMTFAVLKPLLQGFVHHGARYGMREVLFQTGGQAQHLFCGHLVVAGYLAHGRRCLGERARLVEHDNVGFRHMLEVARALHGEAALGAFALRGHNGDAARKAQRAGVVDHQRGSRFGEVARGCRHNVRKQEVPRHQLVGHGLDVLLVGALQCLGLLNHRNDGAQLAFLRVAGNANEDLAFLNRSTGIHGVALLAHDGQRLAGKRALVYARFAGDHLTVGGDLATQAHYHGVAVLQLADGDLALNVAFHHGGGAGNVEQRANQAAFAAALGVVFQDFAHLQQEDGAACGCRLALDEAHGNGGAVQHGHVKAAMAQRIERGFPERDGRDDGPSGAQRRWQEPAAHGAEHDHVGNLREQMAWTRRQHQRVLGLPGLNLFVRKRLKLACYRGACHGKLGLASSFEGHGKAASLGVCHAFGYARKRQKRFLERDRIGLRDFPLKVESDPSGDLMFDRETHGCYLPSAS